MCVSRRDGDVPLGVQRGCVRVKWCDNFETPIEIVQALIYHYTISTTSMKKRLNFVLYRFLGRRKQPCFLCYFFHYHYCYCYAIHVIVYTR